MTGRAITDDGKRTYLGGAGFSIDRVSPGTCAHCGSSTEVTDSRRQGRKGYVWRRRGCVKCGIKFSTIEVRADWVQQIDDKMSFMRRALTPAE